MLPKLLEKTPVGLLVSFSETVEIISNSLKCLNACHKSEAKLIVASN